MAAAMAQAQPEMDARGWDEAVYRRGILRERDLSCRIFFDHHDDPDPDVLLAAASNDSSLSSCISSTHAAPQPVADALADPVCIVQAYSGPAYDVKFYPDWQQPLLYRKKLATWFIACDNCGDDGRIRGWRWHEMQSCLVPLSLQGDHLEPVLDLVNLNMKVLAVPAINKQVGPIPENNAIAINKQEGSVFAAAGDACAYCWDVESGKCKLTFKGRTHYLHSITVRETNHQVVTGSEDGTARIWDCRSGKCTQMIRPVQNKTFEGPWVSCIAIDASESWLILAVGAEPLLIRLTINGTVLSQIKCAPQSAFSVSIHSSGTAAVTGYGSLVDVISELGSHLCTFGCRGLDK